MTLDVSVHNAKVMHVLKDSSCISSDSNPFLGTQVNRLFFHVKHVIERALRHMLKHYVDIRDLWDHSHKDGDVWMSQDALHHYFVLDLLQ